MKSPSPWRFGAGVMGWLTALFLLRVLGQAVQLWLPQAWLPVFAEWQGSPIIYPVLLAIQLAILWAMSRATWRTWKGRTIPSRRAMKWLAGLGTLYMVAAIARIAIGITVEGAPPWFTAFISGAFHVVLAAFVLTCAGYHWLRAPTAGESE